MNKVFIACSLLIGQADAVTLKQYEECFTAIHAPQENSEEAYVWFTGLNHPLFNVVMHLRTDDNVSAAVDSLLAKAAPNSPLSFWVHAENRAEGLAELLKERSFTSIGTLPLMVWEVEPVDTPTHEVGPASKADFQPLVAAIYQEEVSLIEQFGALLKKASPKSYLVYADTIPLPKPVGTGTVVQYGEIGAILNIGTLPEYQKQGYATSMMHFLMNQAHEHNLKYLVLQSSPMAEKLYSSLGFKKILDIEVFVRF